MRRDALTRLSSTLPLQDVRPRPQVGHREGPGAQARPCRHRARPHVLPVDVDRSRHRVRQGQGQRADPPQRHGRAHARQRSRERGRSLPPDRARDVGRDRCAPCSAGPRFGPSVPFSRHLAQEADPARSPSATAIIDVPLLLRSNALRVLLQSFSEGPHELAPSVALVLLFVADSPTTRSSLRPGSDIEMALSGFTDVYGSGESHLHRLKASSRVVSTMLKSWTGAASPTTSAARCPSKAH